MALVETIYRHTNDYPSDERFGLVSQMRRCAVSIPSNISEEAAKSSAADYARSLTMAIGSTAELDTQLELSRRLRFLPGDAFQSLNNQLGSISRMLIALRRSIRTKV
jgi:four helix bundle protein